MHLELWFDYSCPFAYLGSTQAERLAERMGAELSWRPMLLGGVFAANGTPQNLASTILPAKAKHGAEDMQRWAELFGVTLRMPSGHPFRTVEALRATLVTGCDPKVIHAFYRAYWVEGKPPSDAATMREVLTSAGHDADAVLARIQAQEVKDDLRRRTEEAVALGIFGAPSYVVQRAPGEAKSLYWGQDRMHLAAGLTEADVLPPLPAPPADKKPHTLEVYWDFSSPFAYLGTEQAEALAARTGATLVWRPMLLGGLFKTIGQPMVPLETWSAAKQRYYFDDMHRWAAQWGVAFKFPTRFPMSSLKPMRCYLALPEARQKAFRERTFRAYWAEDRDIADDAVLRELLGEAPGDAPRDAPRDDGLEVLARAQTPVVKQALVEATQRAADAGVFGAPTWVVDGRELFWGQDRIPLVERALLR
jgi:2-hydroxychromene-2-carboxylate isomerase